MPSDGSVPRVNERQSIRRVVPAAEGSHSPSESTPAVTLDGLAIPGMGSAATANEFFPGTDSLPDPEEVYEVERVTHAELVPGVGYRVYLKWKGYDEITPRWRQELLAECSNPELLAEVDRAVQDARERRRAEKGSAADDDIPLAEEVVPPPPSLTADVELPPRRVTRFAGSYFRVADVTPSMAEDLAGLEKQLLEHVRALYFYENSFERVSYRVSDEDKRGSCSVRTSESVSGGPPGGDGRHDAPLESAAALGSPSVDGGAALEESLPVGGLSIEVPSMATSTLSDLVPTSERPRDGAGGQDPTWCPGFPSGARAFSPAFGPYGHEFASSVPETGRGGVCGSGYSHTQ